MLSFLAERPLGNKLLVQNLHFMPLKLCYLGSLKTMVLCSVILMLHMHRFHILKQYGMFVFVTKRAKLTFFVRKSSLIKHQPTLEPIGNIADPL